MKNYVCSISDITPENYILFGMKVCRLSELFLSGFKVPDGYGISVEGFKRYCDFNGIDLENKNDITMHILEGNFPDNIKEDLQYIWNALSIQKDEALIVRSSALEEDREEYSCAGIYESVINIRYYNDLEIAVKRCWSSYFTDKALVYRESNCLKHDGIGILVQKMVDGDKSGVIFTRNPLQDKTNAMVIEAHPGLNFAVVDGVVSADKFMVDRQGNVLNEYIYLKKVYYCLGKYSFVIDAVNIETNKRRSSSLNCEEIINLVQIGKQLEQKFNAPSDIEWTIKDYTIYILQTRPISIKTDKGTVNPIYFDGDICDDVECTLLDRYSEPASTCYLSLLQKWEDIVYLSFYTKADGKYCKNKPLMFYFNRVYWNMKYQREYFEDLPFNAGAFKGIIKKLILLRLMLTGYSNWYGRIKNYNKYITQFSSYNIKNAETDQLAALLKKVIDVFCKYLGIDHFRFLGLAQVCYNLLVKKMASFPESNQIISNILELNTSKNMTIKSNNELMELAYKASQCKEISDIFLKEKSEEIYSLLEGSVDKNDYRKEFDKFIIKHGHRGTSCDDLFTPHWVEDTSIVLEIIKQFLSVESDMVFKNTCKKQLEDFEYRKIVIKHIDSQRKNVLSKAWDKKVIFTLITLTSEYMVLRENQRYYFDKSWVLIRKILLLIGDIFVKRGLIMKCEDIFHLTIDEIYNLCDIKSIKCEVNWKETIEKRKKAIRKNKIISPPYLIKNHDFLHLQSKGNKKSFKAIGISAGKATGPVRLISSLKDLSSVHQGEIAVVSTFHPSWTPILCVVSGLVMNYGNILSHGAVVAREYGIPVVVFNGDATRVFPKGQWIEIDGNTGRIRVMETDSNPDIIKD